MSGQTSRTAIVKLRLPAAALARFTTVDRGRKTKRPAAKPARTPAQSVSRPSQSASRSSSATNSTHTPPAGDGTVVGDGDKDGEADRASEKDNGPDADRDTNADADSAAPSEKAAVAEGAEQAGTPADESTSSKRKSLPAAKAGTKRSAPMSSDANSRSRAKPGPKKRGRLDGDGAEGAGNRTSSQVPQASQKLGPKANQGAINAGLRALDRSGAPCRRWELKGCQLKSFTGVVWNVPSWKAPPKPATETASEDATVKDGTSTSSDQKTDHRPLNGTGAISEKSNSGADADTRNPTPSQHPHETPSSPPTTSQQQQKRHSPSVPQSIEVSA